MMSSLLKIGEATKEICQSLATQQAKCDNRYQQHRRDTNTHSDDLCYYQKNIGYFSLIEGVLKGGAYAVMGPAAQVLSQVSGTSVLQPRVTNAQHKVTMDQSLFQKRLEAGSQCSQIAKAVAEAAQGVVRELGRAHSASAA